VVVPLSCQHPASQVIRRGGRDVGHPAPGPERLQPGRLQSRFLRALGLRKEVSLEEKVPAGAKQAAEKGLILVGNRGKHRSGAKALVHYLALTARLKSCPFKTAAELEFCTVPTGLRSGIVKYRFPTLNAGLTNFAPLARLPGHYLCCVQQCPHSFWGVSRHD
jgi:hypothetical protein